MKGIQNHGTRDDAFCGGIQRVGKWDMRKEVCNRDSPPFDKNWDEKKNMFVYILNFEVS